MKRTGPYPSYRSSTLLPDSPHARRSPRIIPESSDPKPSFWAELKRHKVMRVAITYAVVAWLIIQIASATFGDFGIPVLAFRFVVIMLVLFFPVTLIITWAFELTPEGIKTTKSARESQGDEPVSKKQQRKRNWITLGLAAGLPTVIFGSLAAYFSSRIASHSRSD